MFITFEGIDFSGKSTQAKLLFDYLRSKKIRSVLVREPGGTEISEKIRSILLDTGHGEMTPLTEFLLFSASRAQLVHQVIRPELKKKAVVICDRYFDSSSAYQGYGGKLELLKVFKVNEFSTGKLKPEITFLLDISLEVALYRAAGMIKVRDRMEKKGLSFYNSVRKGFKALARANKRRFIIIDGSRDPGVIHKQIIKILNKKLKV